MGQRKDIMLCYPFSRTRLEKWTYYYAQPKLNGLRCRAVMQDSGRVKLYSSEAHVIESVPHIKATLETLWPSSVNVLDGELYKHGMPLQEIAGMVKRKEPHPNHTVLQYAVFDSVSDKGQTDRLAALYHLPIKGTVYRVDTHYCKGDSDFELLLTEYMSHGYEGLVLRKADGLYVATTPTGKRSLDLMKIKPRSEDHYVILGLNQEEDIYGQPKNSVGSFTVCDSDGEVFNVGGGPCLTRANRILYWHHPELVKGKVLRVKYPELTSRGVPRSPVAMEVLEP